MNKNLVIIRSCMRDDFIARHCYESWIKILPDADYIFFIEEGEYKYLPPNVKVQFRRSCNNFGGVLRALPFIEDLKLIKTEGYDYVFVADADIEMIKNPLDEYWVFAGVQDDNNPRHFSGQLLMYRQDLFELVVDYPFYKIVVEEFIAENKPVADDTLLSFVATTFTQTTFNFNNKGYWIHDKLYHLEPK